MFVDGAFWHGHPDFYRGQSGPFWDEKIARNRARDRRVDKDLRDLGWKPLRLWDFEVEKEPEVSAERVKQALVQQRSASESALGRAGQLRRTE